MFKGGSSHTAGAGLPRGADPVIAQQRAQRQRKDALAAIDAALDTLGTGTFVPGDDEAASTVGGGSASHGGRSPPKAPSITSGGVWDSVSVGGRGGARPVGGGSRMSALSAATSVRNITRGDILIEAMKGRDFMTDADLASEQDIQGVLDSLKGALHPAVWQAYQAGADKVVQKEQSAAASAALVGADSDDEEFAGNSSPVNGMEGGAVSRRGPPRAVSPLTSPSSVSSTGSGSSRSLPRRGVARWRVSASGSPAPPSSGKGGGSGGVGHDALLRSVSPITRRGTHVGFDSSAAPSGQATPLGGAGGSKLPEGADSDEEPPPSDADAIAALASRLAARHGTFDPKSAGLTDDDVLLAAAKWGGLGSRGGGDEIHRTTADGSTVGDDTSVVSSSDPASQLRAQLAASRARRAALRESREAASSWGGGDDEVQDFVTGVEELPGYAWAAAAESAAGDVSLGSARHEHSGGDVDHFGGAAAGATGYSSSMEHVPPVDGYGLEHKSA